MESEKISKGVQKLFFCSDKKFKLHRLWICSCNDTILYHAVEIRITTVWYTVVFLLWSFTWFPDTILFLFCVFFLLVLGLASCQVDDVSKMTNKLMLKEFLTQNSRKISDFQIDACSCCVYLVLWIQQLPQNSARMGHRPFIPKIWPGNLTWNFEVQFLEKQKFSEKW